ncbi:MAG: urea carboxylase, partial [Mycobacterium sp.]|nr:urea carboxylase [Mycobacterium sp.]
MTAIEVVRPGMLTTVQDWPGRIGYWHVGVPPSGPMDDLSFRIGNRVLGNPEGVAGLECTRGGPTLAFPDGGRVCVTGAPVTVMLDGVVAAQWQSIGIAAGGVLDVGTLTGPGMRSYVLVAGGLQEPEYLGSTATFTLGAFGGHGGRPL